MYIVITYRKKVAIFQRYKLGGFSAFVSLTIAEKPLFYWIFVYLSLIRQPDAF